MRDVPECLNRRYKAVDDLIQQLSWSIRTSGSNTPEPHNEGADPGIKLMCDFWNILKEDPNCDLKRHVKQRMGLTTPSTHKTYPQELTCYNVVDKDQSKWKDCAQKLRNLCCQKQSKSKAAKEACSHCKMVSGHCHRTDSYVYKSNNASPAPRYQQCKSRNESPVPKTPQSVECCGAHPLGKAINGVNEAATFESQCNDKINDLIITQLKLAQQIEVLETRESDGIKLMKKADCMWSCMEESYKKQLQEATDRQNNLIKQIREIETNNTKWRRNRKEIEDQIATTKRKTKDIEERIAKKKNDQKLLKVEVEDMKKRIEISNAEVTAGKKSLETKKHNSEIKVANMTSEVGRLQKLLKDEYKNKMNKEQTGNRFVKEARQELQKICRVLLKKRLGNEDRRAEKAALLEEINLLNVTMDQCKDRCKLKQDNLSKDIAKLDEEIATYKMKCIQCNKCTDSQDISRFCTDCPRCINDRDCVYKDDYCIQDSTTACVCMSVKEKFLDNVFDNMYTVLERNSQNPQGKLVAEAILNCLKHSRDGKLNTDTKKLVQNFILGTVKKNLNLTIVGGAVKTRCEMEPETYQQLLLCLKKVNPEKIPKEKVDKGTEKKDPCKHWGGRVSECHCPNGPKECVCKQKAPEQPPPPQPAPEDKPPKDDIKPGEVLMCPHKESVTCGPDCGASDALMKVGAEMSKWIPDPCSGPACSFKSVRAVQCVLGPEVLNKPKATTLLPICAVDILDNRITNCSKSCITDNLVSKENYTRERIIEEVMGRYIEVSPIQKVPSGTEGPFPRSFESSDFSATNNVRHFDEGCKTPKVNIIQTADKTCAVRTNIKKYNDRLTADNYNKLENKTARINLFGNSSQTIVLKDIAEIEKLKEEGTSFICKRQIDWDVNRGQVARISTELKVDRRTNEPSFIVILGSKFYAPKSKISDSSLTSFYSVSNSSIIEGVSVASSNDDGSSVEYLVRNIDICKAADDLLKEVIVSESKANNWGPEIEWMSIPSFISRLTRRSKNSFSNLSKEEVELSNTTLEPTTLYNKKTSDNNFIKNLLNETILEKAKEKLVMTLNTRKGCQITKLLDTANILRESKDELSSSSISANSVKKTESHNRCCKYFMQSMMNAACDSFQEVNTFDPSMNCFLKFAKTTSRKPVNRFDYTSANMTSTTTSSASTST